MSRIFDVLTLIIGGVILADLVAHGNDTTNIIKGINNLWGTSVNGLLGKSS